MYASGTYNRKGTVPNPAYLPNLLLLTTATGFALAGIILAMYVLRRPRLFGGFGNIAVLAFLGSLSLFCVWSQEMLPNNDTVGDPSLIGLAAGVFGLIALIFALAALIERVKTRAKRNEQQAP